MEKLITMEGGSYIYSKSAAYRNLHIFTIETYWQNLKYTFIILLNFQENILKGSHAFVSFAYEYHPTFIFENVINLAAA